MAKSNKIAGTILLLFFSWAFKMALAFPPRAMYFPVFVTGVGIVLSLMLVISGFVGKKAEQGEIEVIEKQGKKMTVLMLASMILYVMGIQIIGFCTATLIFLIVSMVMNYPGKADRKAMIKIMVVSVTVTVLIYFIFKKLLYVPLPQGFLI